MNEELKQGLILAAAVAVGSVIAFYIIKALTPAASFDFETESLDDYETDYETESLDDYETESYEDYDEAEVTENETI